MSDPKISVIIPIFNRLELIQQVLRSLQDQTFAEWEALVIDDGSDTETVKSIKQLSLTDSRIQYIRRQAKIKGAPVCRNLGVDLSEGDYIIFVDSDDYMAPWALENRYCFMEKNTHLDFAVFPCVLFRQHPGDMNLLWNTDVSINNDSDIDRFLMLDTPWQTMGPIWRRSSLARLGPWNEDLPSWQDFEFHLRALAYKLKYERHAEPDCFWRVPSITSIGNESRKDVHLISHKHLFSEIYDLLINTQLMNKHRRNLLCSLFFWLMDAWAFQGQKKEALLAWSTCYEKNIINKDLFLQGSIYINISTTQLPRIARKISRRLARTYFKLTWPNHSVPQWSSTFRRTSVPSQFQPKLDSLLEYISGSN